MALYIVSLTMCSLVAGGTPGECSGMVPQSPWLWLLAVGHRRQYTDAKPTVPRALGSHSGE